MIILAVKTDQQEAYLGIWNGQSEIAKKVWTAHRQLANTLYSSLDEILHSANLVRQQIEGIVCFEGPGSFTGLRIGLSAANALAFVMGVPIVASGSDNWIYDGVSDIESGQNQKVVLPKYGGDPNITIQKK